jgi:hypothetical protein
MSNNNGARWKDCSGIYPDIQEIAAALQDKGKHDTVKRKGKEQPRHKCPLIEKLGAKIYGLIREKLNPEGLTKNVTRDKGPLCKEILIARKHVDVTETAPVFHEVQKDGKVYLITNHPVHAGIDLCVERFQAHIESLLYQKNTARTSNDGLRLACIMLDSNYRATVSGIMTRKKDRKKSDVPGDPTLHFFESILTECFLNPSYQVMPPPSKYYDEFPEDEKGNWGPNSPFVFEHERNAEWLRMTWDEYVKPKYKKALDRWNKDTGGGDGTAPSFIEYCAGDRWLVYLFCKDEQSNFLLANSAGG